jgi:uncharacterized protein
MATIESTYPVPFFTEQPSSERRAEKAHAPNAVRLGRRWGYLTLGWAFFALGVVGAVLPLLPTTPFMILAAWAFSKSSPRFEKWLLEHRWFGPSLRRFKEQRVVPLKAKWMSWGTMSVTFTYCALSGHVPLWGLVAQAALMGYGAWYVSRFPSRPPTAEQKRAELGKGPRNP